jgi:hypothetical protein
MPSRSETDHSKDGGETVLSSHERPSKSRGPIKEVQLVHGKPYGRRSAGSAFFEESVYRGPQSKMSGCLLSAIIALEVGAVVVRSLQDRGCASSVECDGRHSVCLLAGVYDR